MTSLKTSLRSHGCGELRAEHVGAEVALCGWLHARRDHGGVLFLDLRDRSGLVQVVARPQDKAVFEAASGLKSEYVVRVTGKVEPRPQGTENPNLPTGAVEVPASKIEVLNSSDAPPFEISDHATVSEEGRLSYRYLDLRRSRMQRNLMARHRMISAIREYLNERGFVDVETPILTKSTPEGARDFLVPSRLSPGQFYALPQSPQLFKQILMVAGFERYYQIARCFRDEDLRADRQPEFTQLDLEMSFVGEEDILALNEGLIQHVLRQAFGAEISLPLPRLSYEDAMRRFGSDKPDLRIGFEIQELSEQFRQTQFKVFRNVLERKGPRKGAVRALQVGAEGFAPSRSEIDDLTKFVSQFGAKGLAWIRWEDGGPNSPIVKFFSQAELDGVKASLKPEKGQFTFLVADDEDVVAKSLGALRLELARRWPVLSGPDHGAQKWNLLWVHEFPAFEWSEEEKRWVSMHHPFTSPTAEGLLQLDTAVTAGAEKAIFDPDNAVIRGLKSRAYDLVLNGTEIGGGSIRIHRPDIQQKVFTMLGISVAEARSRFGFLLDALKFGAPPHGGIAWGLDRIAALMCGEDSIREVMAFPKTAKGTDLMTNAPSEVSPRQLKELHIATVGQKK